MIVGSGRRRRHLSGDPCSAGVRSAAAGRFAGALRLGAGAGLPGGGAGISSGTERRFSAAPCSARRPARGGGGGERSALLGALPAGVASLVGGSSKGSAVGVIRPARCFLVRLETRPGDGSARRLRPATEGGILVCSLLCAPACFSRFFSRADSLFFVSAC